MHSLRCPHYPAVVLLPRGTKRLLPAVARILEPYGLERKAEPYETDCECIGDAAWREAEAEARELFGLPVSNSPGQLPAFEYPEAYHKTCVEIFLRHPRANAPDPECELCGGSGRMTAVTVFNPAATWDRFEIGGRYADFFRVDYDPETDPVNWKPCPRCSGTGEIAGDGQQPHLQQPEGQQPVAGQSCARCKGTGRINVWAKDRSEFMGAVVPVRVLDESTSVPSAVITPDGIWHQSNVAPPVGSEQRDAAGGAWSAWYTETLSRYQDLIAVACDLER